MSHPLRQARDAWRKHQAGYRRLHERRSLLDRPWEEDYLHFTPDGEVHGRLLPPDDGRRHSVTSDGWCPQWRPEDGGGSGAA